MCGPVRCEHWYTNNKTGIQIGFKTACLSNHDNSNYPIEYLLGIFIAQCFYGFLRLTSETSLAKDIWGNLIMNFLERFKS